MDNEMEDIPSEPISGKRFENMQVLLQKEQVSLLVWFAQEVGGSKAGKKVGTQAYYQQPSRLQQFVASFIPVQQDYLMQFGFFQQYQDTVTPWCLCGAPVRHM